MAGSLNHAGRQGVKPNLWATFELDYCALRSMRTGECAYATFLNFVTRPTSTHSTTKMFPA